MAISHIAWILIAATHVGYGSNVSMQEFGDESACERAAAVVRAVSDDAGYRAHTWCVPKESK
jgi:hypothetical protein